MGRIQTGIRFDQELISAIDEVAAIEHRDRNSLIEHMASSYIRDKYPGLWAEAFPDLAAKRAKYITEYKEP